MSAGADDARASSSSCSVPVMPYSSEIPYSSVPDAIAPSTKYFIAALRGHSRVAIERDERVLRQRQHLEPEVQREHAVRRDHDHDPEQAEQAEHEELAFQQAVVLQVFARIEERDAERDVREHLQHAARGVRDVAAART